MPGIGSTETFGVVSAIREPIASETTRTFTWPVSKVTVDSAPFVAPVSCIFQPAGWSQENVLSMAV